MTEYPYYWIVTHRTGEVDGAGASRCKAFLDRVCPTWTAGRSFIDNAEDVAIAMTAVPFGELGGFPAGGLCSVPGRTRKTCEVGQVSRFLACR